MLVPDPEPFAGWTIFLPEPTWDEKCAFLISFLPTRVQRVNAWASHWGKDFRPQLTTERTP